MTTTIRRGILTAYDAPNFKATVRFDGSFARVVTDIRVSRAITAGMTLGRLVAVCFFEDRNPRDAVLFAVWTA
jgi:hypothetical protein